LIYFVWRQLSVRLFLLYICLFASWRNTTMKLW